VSQSNLKNNFSPKPKRTARDVAELRSRAGLQLSARLEAAASAVGDEIGWRMARDVARCCERSNVYVARGMQNEYGVFDGTATLWSCGHLLCPNCHPRDARRLRKRARAVLEPMDVRVGERMRFLTLTLPTARAVGLLKSYEIFKTAWELFRKRKFWKDLSPSGVVRLEWQPNADGFHIHAHAVLAVKKIDFDECRAEWGKCIANAWAHHGIDQKIATRSGLPFVNIKFTYDRKDRSRTENLRYAVVEAVKYVCKPTSWLALSDADLLAVATASLERDRLPRSFEVLGRARQSSRPATEAARDDRRILDTGSLSDGEAKKNLSDGADWTDASFDGDAAALIARAMALGRREAMRLLPRWLWLYVTTQKIAREQGRRREGLSTRYAQAEFETLAGDSWRGVCVRPAPRALAVVC
jgi:hypothetical protein